VGHFYGLRIFFEFEQVQLVDEELLVALDREELEDVDAGELSLFRCDRGDQLVDVFELVSLHAARSALDGRDELRD